jgi:hypothetical protein
MSADLRARSPGQQTGDFAAPCRNASSQAVGGKPMSEAEPRYTVGEPWRRQATGDPPHLDYSEMDDWVCPVYRGSGDQRVFFVDAVVTPTDEEWSAEGVARKRSTLRAPSTCSRSADGQKQHQGHLQRIAARHDAEPGKATG